VVTRVARVLHFARRVVPFLFGVVLAPFVLNAVVAAQHLPEYASWTGILPLEEKLQKLGTFSSHGPTDAIILGSSIPDFGISAELLSKDMTAATGKPYRVFNFSTGGTELMTTPTLYRLARTVTKPRTLLLSVPEEIKRPDVTSPRSPDYTLERAPIGTAIAHPWLFPFEKRFWDVPLVRYAAPFRDRLIFGRFVHVPSQGSDLYWMDPYGDTVSYSFQTSRTALNHLRRARDTTIVPLTPHQMSMWSQQRKLKHFFNDVDIRAMTELRKLTTADGCRIVIVAHDVASDYFPTPLDEPKFDRGRRQFFTVLSRQVHAKVIYEVEKFKAQQYMLTDEVHLNYYGAKSFTRLIAAALSSSHKPPLETPILKEPKLPDIPSSNPSISAFSVLVEAPKRHSARTLRLRILRNHAIPSLPDVPLEVMLRLPSNTDVTAPARLTSPTSLTATFTALPPGSDQIFLARIVYEAGGRLVAANQPVSAYTWTG
jgi:hypothetical protein